MTLEKTHKRKRAVKIGGKILTELRRFDNVSIISEKKNSIIPPRNAPITETKRAPQNLPSTFFLRINTKKRARAKPMRK